MGSEAGSEAAQELSSLQSSYTFFSPCLQIGPLNPSILGCTDPLLPQSISCHHPELPTPSLIPGKQKQPSQQTLLGHWERVGVHTMVFPSKVASTTYSSDVLCRQRSFRKWGQGLGLFTRFTQPIPLPFAHAVGTGQHSLSTCPRGLVAVQGTACLWVVTLRLEVLGKHGCGDSQTLAQRRL